MNHLMLLLLFAFVGLGGLGVTGLLVVNGQSSQDRLKPAPGHRDGAASAAFGGSRRQR